MKRVSFFLTEDEIRELKKHKAAIQRIAGTAPWRTISVSDLIRYALLETYEITYISKHAQPVIIKAYLAQLKNETGLTK